jgi:hypothetical protein
MKKMSLVKKVLTIVLLIGIASTAHAAIVSSLVDVGMKITYDDNNSNEVVDAINTASDPLSASVSFVGPTTGASVYSSLSWSPISMEAATLNFSIGWDGGGYTGAGYLGYSDINSNMGTIIYSASSPTKVVLSWNFGFTGSSPWGLQCPYVYDNNGALLDLPDLGTTGKNYDGSQTFIITGQDDFHVNFYPNISTDGSLAGIQGDLVGYISMNFTPVPVPAAIWLLGSGLLGLSGFRKTFKK